MLGGCGVRAVVGGGSGWGDVVAQRTCYGRGWAVTSWVAFTLPSMVTRRGGVADGEVGYSGVGGAGVGGTKVRAPKWRQLYEVTAPRVGQRTVRVRQQRLRCGA